MRGVRAREPLGCDVLFRMRNEADRTGTDRGAQGRLGVVRGSGGVHEPERAARRGGRAGHLGAVPREPAPGWRASAAPSRSSSATPSWPCSAHPSRTRTTPSAPCAGLAIRDAIADLGGDLHVRIGINTGEALVSVGADPQSGEGMVAGDVVNTALAVCSRRRRRWRPSWVVTYVSGRRNARSCSKHTNRSTRRARPNRLRVGSQSEPRSYVPSRRRSLQFVGRDREHERLIAAFEDSRAGPKRQLVTVVSAGNGRADVAELGALHQATGAHDLAHGHVFPTAPASRSSRSPRS